MRTLLRGRMNKSAGFLALAFLFSLVLGACSDDDMRFVVGPEGAIVLAPGITLVIPKGALSSTQEFTISYPDVAEYPADGAIIGAPVKIEPDVTFQKEVTIAMHYVLPGGVNLMNAGLAVVQAGAWSPIPETTVDLTDESVYGTVLQFSTYTPYWYEPPAGMMEGYYINAWFDNRTGAATVGADNSLYNDDGKTASFGTEGTDTSTWTPFAYTMRADGLVKDNYRLPNGTPVHEYGIFNPDSKVDCYFQTSAVDDLSIILFGFQKPADDYAPSLAGSSYFVGGYQSSATDTDKEVYADRIDFETDAAGTITSQDGVEIPFTYVVAGGGKVTLTATYTDGPRVLGIRLNEDASLVVDAYENTNDDRVGVVVGARLSSGKTDADLSGVYHTILYQPDESDKRVRYRTMTFDGQGGGTYATYDEQLEYVEYTGQFTYSVNDDGTFDLNMTDLSEGYDEPSVLSADDNVFVNPDHFGTHQTFTIGIKKITQ